MKVEYVSKDTGGQTYEIEADRHGNYSIRRAGKVVKRVSSVSSYLDKPRWGSKKLELAAIEDAKAAIDAHHRAEG